MWLTRPLADLAFAPGDLEAFITLAAGNTEGLQLLHPSLCSDSLVAYPVLAQLASLEPAPTFVHTGSVDLQAPFATVAWWTDVALPLLKDATFAFGVQDMWSLPIGAFQHTGTVNAVCAYHPARGEGHLSGVGSRREQLRRRLGADAAMAEAASNAQVLSSEYSGGDPALWQTRSIMQPDGTLQVITGALPQLSRYRKYKVYPSPPSVKPSLPPGTMLKPPAMLKPPTPAMLEPPAPPLPTRTPSEAPADYSAFSPPLPDEAVVLEMEVNMTSLNMDDMRAAMPAGPPGTNTSMEFKITCTMSLPAGTDVSNSSKHKMKKNLAAELHVPEVHLHHEYLQAGRHLLVIDFKVTIFTANATLATEVYGRLSERRPFRVRPSVEATASNPAALLAVKFLVPGEFVYDMYSILANATFMSSMSALPGVVSLVARPPMPPGPPPKREETKIELTVDLATFNQSALLATLPPVPAGSTVSVVLKVTSTIDVPDGTPLTPTALGSMKAALALQFGVPEAALELTAPAAGRRLLAGLSLTISTANASAAAASASSLTGGGATAAFGKLRPPVNATATPPVSKAVVVIALPAGASASSLAALNSAIASPSFSAALTSLPGVTGVTPRPPMPPSYVPNPPPSPLAFLNQPPVPNMPPSPPVPNSPPSPAPPLPNPPAPPPPPPRFASPVNISGSFVLPFSGALFNNPSTGPFYSAALVSGLAAALNIAPSQVTIAVLDTSTARRLSAFSCQVQYSIRTDSTLAGALTSSILATASSGALRGALNNALASVATANSLPALVIPAGYLIVVAVPSPPPPPPPPSPPLPRSPPPTLVPASQSNRRRLLALLALLALLPLSGLAVCLFLRSRRRLVAGKVSQSEASPMPSAQGEASEAQSADVPLDRSEPAAV